MSLTVLIRRSSRKSSQSVRTLLRISGGSYWLHTVTVPGRSRQFQECAPCRRWDYLPPLAPHPRWLRFNAPYLRSVFVRSSLVTCLRARAGGADTACFHAGKFASDAISFLPQHLATPPSSVELPYWAFDKELVSLKLSQTVISPRSTASTVKRHVPISPVYALARLKTHDDARLALSTAPRVWGILMRESLNKHVDHVDLERNWKTAATRRRERHDDRPLPDEPALASEADRDSSHISDAYRVSKLSNASQLSTLFIHGIRGRSIRRPVKARRFWRFIESRLPEYEFTANLPESAVTADTCFIHFESHGEADEALKQLRNVKFFGSMMRVGWALPYLGR